MCLTGICIILLFFSFVRGCCWWCRLFIYSYRELPKHRLLLGKLNYACEIPKGVHARALLMHFYHEFDIENEAIRSFSSDDISAISRSVQIRLMCFAFFSLSFCFYFTLRYIFSSLSLIFIVHLLIKHSVYAWWSLAVNF